MNLTNREIDAMVATHVFGEPIPLTEPDGIDGTPIGIWTPIDVYGGPSVWDCPKFSTDPAASKQLRDKMRKLGWNWNSRWRADQVSILNGWYSVEIWRGTDE